ARARRDHFLAKIALAGVIRRTIDVDEDFGPAVALNQGRSAGVPNVLAYIDADEGACDLVDRRARAGPEIAILVEDAVIGKVVLVIDVDDRAVVGDRRRVVDIVV